MYQKSLYALLLAMLIAVPTVASPETKPSNPVQEVSVQEVSSSVTTLLESPLGWMNDYAMAMHRAKAEKRMLLIAFCGTETADFKAFLAPGVLDDAKVQKQLKSFLLLKLPNDVRVDLGKKENIELLKHSTFREMCGTSGIVMIDFRNEGAKYYGHVVSTFPVLRGKRYTKNKFLTILGLPAGTLTQRTLIYAVRIHPESPKSTDGDLSEYLTSEALAHSAHQARIRLQGHHNWESRFHRISRSLPSGLQATEVCAESWPNEGLLKAAIECVRCWHYSSGHWRQVNGFHRLWGYDMRRGSNRIWYATGIFSQKR